ncbi:MAG: hypothetical protein M1832_001574 [Thelocarpon impressellum]|nr:MAG: hypothetical protein M1832_001574 [Thelocarpon impressellum]
MPNRDGPSTPTPDDSMADSDLDMATTDPETSDRWSMHTSTKSLVGSVLDYPVENGRRYCDTGPDAYFMPNDEQEQTRLNILHQMYLLLLRGELTLAPVSDDPDRILDIGTGTGEWAIAMAERYPDADVTGTDLSAIQPDAVPSNVFFEVDNAEEEWTFSSQYDLIHARNLSGSFRSWQAIYEECFRHLKPGGYLEVIDFDYPEMDALLPNSVIAIYVGAVREAADRAGRPWGIGHLKRSMFEAAGFEEVKVTTMEVPLGPWPDDPVERSVGKMWLVACLEGMVGGSLRLLTRDLGWEVEEVLELCTKLRALLVSESLRIHTPM